VPAFFIYEFRTFRQSTIRQLSSLGEITAANSTAALAFEDRADATEILAALTAQHQVVAACLYEQNGRLLAKYPENAPDTAFPATPGPTGYNFEHSFLAGFQPVVQSGNKRLGTLYLRFDTGTIMAEWLRVSLGIGGSVTVVVLLVAYALSQLLQRQISRPIVSLAESAKAVSDRSDYSVRAIKYGDDELGLLTDAFNQMLAQIERQNLALRGSEAELEQRVIKRTAELAAANTELEKSRSEIYQSAQRVQASNQQLQAANKELESFSYSISHDLRAPLRHIDGFAGLLAKHAGGTLDEKGNRYLATISASAKRLGQLIDELLVFSRMGRTELRHTPLNSRAMVDEVIRELQPDLQGRQVEWKIGELPSVQADPAMLRQVWANLLGNAVKYTRNRPVARIAIEQQPNGTGETVFAVRDNGAGFDMQYASKLFGVFQRLHTVNEFEGTGIGLANVHRIVQRHGGRVWAEGAVGEGATFFFSLPANGNTPASTSLNQSSSLS